MGVNYKGLINGNINPLDVAKLLAKHYGGEHGLSFYKVHFTSVEGMFQITFLENATEEQKLLRPWERTKACGQRMLTMFIDGACKGDYSEVTTDPMTYVSLGHYGDCREIIDSLVRSQGGYVYDELGPKETREEWVRLEVAEAARAAEAVA